MKSNALAVFSVAALTFSAGCGFNSHRPVDMTANWQTHVDDCEARIAQVKQMPNESDLNKQRAIAIIKAQENYYRHDLKEPAI